MEVIDYDTFLKKCKIIIDSCNENISELNPITDYLRGRIEGINQLIKFVDTEVLDLTDLMNEYGQEHEESMRDAYD